MKEFGEVIKGLRTSRGVTQRQLAAALSVDPTTISQYENGRRSFPPELLEPACQYLEVSVWQVLAHIYPPTRKDLEFLQSVTSTFKDPT